MMRASSAGGAGVMITGCSTTSSARAAVRLAVEAALPGEPSELVNRWRDAGAAQQSFAIDMAARSAAWPARQRMIDLQIAHARKQMRANRPDLAWRELIAAAQWERADCPNAALRINQGLVAGRLGDAEAESRLREGVDGAGGGVAGWLQLRCMRRC